jgi:hypothetical protein
MAANESTMFDAAFADDAFSDGPWANAWQPVWDDPPAPGVTTSENQGFGASAEAPAEPFNTMRDYGSA